MTAEHWKRIKRVFTKAAEIGDPSTRDAYLRNTCQGEDRLRAEVDSLLGQLRKAQHEHFLSAYSSMDGKTILHYRVLAKIGEGGMGIAYKALDTRLNRLVVLKMLPPLLMADPESRSRFVQEAKSASALNHPNVVTIHDIAQVNGVDVIVMEYVPGKTLDGVIPSTGLTVSQALHYALQIVEALAAAHTANILHGDLKPLNIMVTDDGRVKLLDFGLAKMLASTHRDLGKARRSNQFGTPAYMAPEQQLRDRNLKADPRLEIFSFGLILHQMLSGSHPFGSGRGDELSEAIRSKDHRVLPPTVPASLATIVERCLQKKPDGRFKSMPDLLIALRKCLGVKNRNALRIGFPPLSSPIEHARHRREEMEAAGEPAAVGFISSVEMEQIRAIAGRIEYRNIAKSRQALAELASLMDGNASQAIREAVTSTLRDLILTVDDFDGNFVPFPVRELRKSVLDLIRKLSQDNLSRCFKGRDLEFLDLYGMDFSSELLTGTSFKGCFLVEANFQRSNLVRASFTGARVRNVNFAGADLSGADLTDADWFNALALTESQLRSVRQDTLVECPPGLPEMHRYLETHYALPFESWSTRVQEQLKSTWNEYLRPNGLREIVARWRRKSR